MPFSAPLAARLRSAATPEGSASPCVDVVCYGLGSISLSSSSQLQFACILALRSHLRLSGVFCCYDPLMTRLDDRVAAHFHLSPLRVNEEAKRRVHRPTLFFMPHCPPSLYNRLIWANWPHPPPPTSLPIHPSQANAASTDGLEQLAEEVERLQVGEEEPSTSLLPLRHVVVVGNSFASILARPAFQAPSAASAVPSKGRTRLRETSKESSSACPLHSVPPPLGLRDLSSASSTAAEPSSAGPHPSSRPPSTAQCRTLGVCDCLCMLSELQLLRTEDLSDAVEQSEADVATAMHGTVVQWCEWPEEALGEEEQRRLTGWLQQPLPEPSSSEADDAEIVLAQDTSSLPPLDLIED